MDPAEFDRLIASYPEVCAEKARLEALIKLHSLVSGECKPTPTRKKAFTKQEAAVYLGIGTSTLDAKRRQKLLVEDYDLGTPNKPRPMFSKGTLDRYLQTHSRTRKK